MSGDHEHMDLIRSIEPPYSSVANSKATSRTVKKYDRSALGVLNYYHGFSMWHYAAHNVVDALEDGFFNFESDRMFRNGDIIILVDHTKTAMRQIVIAGDRVVLSKLY